MPNRIVTASLVVSFTTEGSGDGDGELKLEVDSRPDGLNGGKTSFGIEDDVYILLFKSANVDVTKITCTSGSLSPAGSGLADETDTLSFAKSAEANLGYPYASGGAIAWMGASGGTPTFTAGKSLVKVPNAVIAIGKATYKAAYTAYKLSGVGDVESVLVYAEGTVA